MNLEHQEKESAKKVNHNEEIACYKITKTNKKLKYHAPRERKGKSWHHLCFYVSHSESTTSMLIRDEVQYKQTKKKRLFVEQGLVGATKPGNVCALISGAKYIILVDFSGKRFDRKGSRGKLEASTLYQ